MKVYASLRFLAIVAIVIGSILLIVQTRHRWSKWLTPSASNVQAHPAATAPITEPKVLKLTAQGRKNLGLVSKAARPQNYWRTIQVPGVVADRPGISDRGVASPAVGVITAIYAHPGDTVKPGDPLFALRPSSEYLQSTQSELFKAQQESQLIAEQRARLQNAAVNGAISESRLIELDNQARRQTVAIQSHRQDLLTRGLTESQIDSVAAGRFVTSIEVSAPALLEQSSKANEANSNSKWPAIYEVQELNVDLGQQVQAGQILSMLANHRDLFIEGHAFKKEASLLSEAARNRTELRVEFAEDDSEKWPSQLGRLEIRHLANAIDPVSRTFSFYVPLENQAQEYEKANETYVIWRFRPGQRVRLHIPVEELHDVFVLPSAAVVREGPEAYVFQQNGDLFNRLAVSLLYEDRLHAVIANDGAILSGLYLAQSSAASLNRVLKAQAASGVRADVHVHADGTVHAAH